MIMDGWTWQQGEKEYWVKCPEHGSACSKIIRVPAWVLTRGVVMAVIPLTLRGTPAEWVGKAFEFLN